MMLISFIKRLELVVLISATSLGGVCLGQGLVINELMTENRLVAPDEYDDFPAWIELRNTSPVPLDLAGYAIGLDSQAESAWEFPSMTIAPGESIVVFCSGKDLRSGDLDSGFAPGTELEPDQVPGLKMWLDASEEESLVTADGAVLEWRDVSGNGNHATQTEPKRQPVHTTFAPSGIPVVNFDGYDDWMVFPRISDICAVYWVLREDPMAPQTHRPLLGDDTHFDFLRGRNGLMFSADNTPKIQFGGGVAVNGEVVDKELVRVPRGPAVITVVTGDNARANLLSADRPSVADLDWIWQGWFAEVLIYNQAPSLDQVKGIERYLNRKWRVPLEYLHTDFVLDPNSGKVYLFDPVGSVVDEVDVPPLLPDVSYGRRIEGEEFGYFSEPTPGSLNDSTPYLGIAPPPMFSELPGYQPDPYNIRITTDVEGATVHWTLNGLEPTNDPETEFKKDQEKLFLPEEDFPFDVNGIALRLSAKVFHDDLIPSKTVNRFFGDGDPPSIPTAVIFIDPIEIWNADIGIYNRGPYGEDFFPYRRSNFWRLTERRIEFQWIDGPDGSVQHSFEAGLRIHGDRDRALFQRSFAITARPQYGDPPIEFPFFEDIDTNRFQRLLLQNSREDWERVLFREGLMHRLMANQDLDWQAYRPVRVRFPGASWGIYNLREPSDKYFIAAKTGLDLGEFDLLQNNKEILNGDRVQFDTFLFLLGTNDPTSEGFEDVVTRLMEVDNFFDYCIAQLFFDNIRWDEKVRYWQPRGGDGRWRWIPYDMDRGFNLFHEEGAGIGVERNTLAAVLPNLEISLSAPFPPAILARLLKNERFRLEFIERFLGRLNQDYSSERVQSVIDSVKADLDPEIVNQILSFGRQMGLFGLTFSSVDEWNANVEFVRDFAERREDIVRGHVAEYFGLSEPATLTLNASDPESGAVFVNGIEALPLADTWSGIYFKEMPIRLEAAARSGYRFVKWQELEDSNAAIQVTLDGDLALTPIFELADRDFEIATLGVVDSKFGIRFQAQSGVAYRIEAKDALSDATWSMAQELPVQTETNVVDVWFDFDGLTTSRLFRAVAVE